MINSNPQYNDLIDSYLDNSMSLAEQESFMLELENNAELKKEYAFHLELQQAIADPEYDKVKATISEVVNPNEKELNLSQGKPAIYRVLKYAAAIVAIVIATVFITQYFPSEHTSAALMNDYFEPYPAYNTFRGDVTTEDLIESAFSNYELKKYKAAESDFAQLTAGDPSNMAFIFYQANALLAQNNFDGAQQLFTQVVESRNDLFSDQAKWYMVLSVLGGEDVESAKSILNEIVDDPNSSYKQKATELLGRLK